MHRNNDKQSRAIEVAISVAGNVIAGVIIYYILHLLT